MRRHLFGTMILAAVLGLPAAAQTAGHWVATSDGVTLQTPDGAAVSVGCDAARAMIVLATPRAPGPAPQWLTLRGTNGAAVAVRLRASGAAMTGAVATALIDPAGLPAADGITITAPPSGRAEIVAEAAPALSVLIAGCRAG